MIYNIHVSIYDTQFLCQTYMMHNIYACGVHDMRYLCLIPFGATISISGIHDTQYLGRDHVPHSMYHGSYPNNFFPY